MSVVITSCGGTFSVIVRRSTLTIRSITGMSRKRPGPFGSGSSRPRRKITPRSYSRATLIAAKRNISTRKAAAAMAIRAINESRPFGSGCRRSYGEAEAVRVDGLDDELRAGLEGGAVGAARLPELAVDED